jgi:hypothetical protein
LINDLARQDERIVLQVNQRVSMGIIIDVKTEIRKAERLKLHYIAYKDID